MLKLVYAENAESPDIQILTNGLDANAKLKRGYPPVESFAIFLKDENAKIVGGCNGLLYYGCLFIDQLWVDEAYRGQKYGTKLLDAAEKLGKDKGCLFSTLETMDWEALDFYKAHGYVVEMERHGYNDNVVMYLLRKDW